jgi:hypothetical protein
MADAERCREIELGCSIGIPATAMSAASDRRRSVRSRLLMGQLMVRLVEDRHESSLSSTSSAIRIQSGNVVTGGLGQLLGNTVRAGSSPHLVPHLCRLDAGTSPKYDQVIEKISALSDYA